MYFYFASFSQTTSGYYHGIFGSISLIARDEGLGGLYKGLGATLLGVGPAIAINFCVYETLKANWTATRSDLTGPIVSLGCGSLAGLCSSTVTFPLDLVRRRMQLRGAGGSPSISANPISGATVIAAPPQMPHGIIAAFRQIVQREGWCALYRGIIPEYIKVVPGVSIAFMTYEYMKDMFQEMEEYR